MNLNQEPDTSGLTEEEADKLQAAFDRAVDEAIERRWEARHCES